MVRVLDLTDTAMAYAGRLLADMGAEVTRAGLPGDRVDGLSGASRPYFGRGVRRITVDSHRPDGARAVLDLCRAADVVVDGITLGFGDHEALCAEARRTNPALVWVGVREFDPRVATPPVGGEAVRYARSGLMSITGDPAGPPLLAGGGLPNAIVAAYAALAVLLGARAARATGTGRLIWVSAYEALASFMAQGLLEAALTGKVVRRGGGRHAHIAMAGALPCRDGHAVISANERSMWRALVDTVGDPRLDDAALDDEHERMRRQAEIFAAAGEWTAGFGKAELAEFLQARRIPVAPVHDPLDVARDPHLHARGFFRSLEDGAVATLATPWTAADAAEFDVGHELPVLRAGPFSLADFVRWAGYQENWLRIHYDEAYATGPAQLPGAVQSGNHRTALMLRMITDWVGDRGHVRRLSVRHTAPVRVGDDLVCAGRVLARKPREGGGLTVELEVWATTGNGQRASEGTAVVEVMV